MKISKMASIYCLLVGASMIGMWAAFIVTGTVPEFEERPAEIALHLAAEFTTAIALIVAGLGLARGSGWGSKAYLLASGLLTYTLIVSPGYYLTNDEPIFVVMFTAFLAIDLLLLALMLRTTEA